MEEEINSKACSPNEPSCAAIQAKNIVASWTGELTEFCVRSDSSTAQTVTLYCFMTAHCFVFSDYFNIYDIKKRHLVSFLSSSGDEGVYLNRLNFSFVNPPPHTHTKDSKNVNNYYFQTPSLGAQRQPWKHSWSSLEHLENI